MPEVDQARRLIHDNNVDGLRELLAGHPWLLTWRADTATEDDATLLGFATGSFGDSGDPVREERFTRYACAELLLDSGALVTPAVCEALLRSRAHRLLALFHRRGLLPSTLPYLIALGDEEAVRARLATGADDRAALNQAFLFACHYQHRPLAELLCERAELLDEFLAHPPDVHDPAPFEPEAALVRQRIVRAAQQGDLPALTRLLREHPSLLSAAQLKFQFALIEKATLAGRAASLEAFLVLDPAILRDPKDPGRVYAHAFTYKHGHLLSVLQRLWPLPDDLPHAAGAGDLERVQLWFDPDGQPALGPLEHHFPANDRWIRGNLQWGPPTAQQVLDTALAFAVMNHHFDVAEFLLAQGADINTDWSSHEPASILHELVWTNDREAMQFLIDHGIDLDRHDYRWQSTAAGWAEHAAQDAELAQWLRDASRLS